MLDELKEKLEEIDFSGKLKYLIIVFILVGMTLGSAYATYTSVKVFKPLIFGLEFSELPITIDNVRLTYNVDTNRYSEAIMTLRNKANQNFDNIKVSVIFYNNVSQIIASGEIVTTLSANQVKSVSLSLTWMGQNTILDCSSGRITISA